MQGQEPGEARNRIETGYACLAAAVGRKDLAAIRSVYTAGYCELQVGGEERDLDDVMAAWADDLGCDPSLQIAIDRVDPNGNEANVVARSTLTYVDSVVPSVRFIVRVETTGCDRWIRTGSGWRLTRSHRQLTKLWIDDKLHREMRFEPPLTAGERSAVVRDLGRHALPFDTVLAGSGYDDLAPLDRLIGDARIVALGEASHGTAEIFQMKHRLLQYLVEKKGFTVFAIEGNWLEAQAADRFIKTGEGSATAALAKMHFWTWRTEEVRALIDWMRAYNTTRGDYPVLSFAGFDMQSAAQPIERVTDFLACTGVVDACAVRRLYDGVKKLEEKSETAISAGELTRLRNCAAQALDLIDAQREALIAASTLEDYRAARQAAQIVCQFTRMHAGVAWAERDAAMAENVRWLLEEAYPGQKIVLWAHNGHVAAGPIVGDKSMGNHLRERYDDQMVVIGFALHHGEVRAKRLAGGRFQPGRPVALPLAPAQKTSLEALFFETGLPRFILDLRGIVESSALDIWLAKARPHRSIGSGHDPDRDTAYVHVSLRAAYDAMIFIAESTAAKPLHSETA
jgi:erythromycin esterase